MGALNDRSNIPPLHGIPSLENREIPDFSTCPFCTMQMPTDARTCPHCNSQNPVVRDFRELLASPKRYGRQRLFLRRHWQLIVLGGAIVLAFLVTATVYYGWVGHRVAIVPNPAFKVKVVQGVENGKVVLKGEIRNIGEDVPDLSLKSIRVTATFGLSGGGRRIESVFPRSAHRGEGSLLRAETGYFRIEIPEDKVEDATLSTEVVDLTCGQPSQKCPVPPLIRAR